MPRRHGALWLAITLALCRSSSGSGRSDSSGSSGSSSGDSSSTETVDPGPAAEAVLAASVVAASAEGASPQPQGDADAPPSAEAAWERLQQLMSDVNVANASALLEEALKLRSGVAGSRKQPWKALPVLEALAGAVGNHAVPSDTSAAAMRELGHMHLRGEGVTADAAVAVRHYEHAAELGDTESQSILGVLHSTGFGAPRDAPLAATYMYFAAEGGDIHAQLAMGYRHLLGVAATKACHKSLLYYTPVAEKVVANAQRHQSGGTIEKVRRHIVLRVHIAAATAFES